MEFFNKFLANVSINVINSLENKELSSKLISICNVPLFTPYFSLEKSNKLNIGLLISNDFLKNSFTCNLGAISDFLNKSADNPPPNIGSLIWAEFIKD